MFHYYGDIHNSYYVDIYVYMCKIYIYIFNKNMFKYSK